MECSKCEVEMVQDEVSEDCFSYKTGHYTREHKVYVCPQCGEQTDARECDNSDDRYEQKMEEQHEQK